MVKNFFPYILFLLLLGSLFSCSTEEDDIHPPKPEYEYLVEVTDSVFFNRSTLVERLSGIANTPLAKLLPDTEIRTDAIQYHSQSPSGEPLEASGIITYPTSGLFKGVIIGQHHTIGADKEAPSSTMAMIESALALFGYVVITPDNLGFGSTVHLPQNYLHAESVGRVTADMVFATREYLKNRERPIDKEVYVAGYSQGAFSSLAFARTAQEKYPKDIPIRKVFAGGGPYDPVSMFDLFITEDELSNPATVLLTIVGLDYADQLNLDYTRIFIEPALSNYTDWIISKKYTLSNINKKIGSKRMDSFIHPDIYLPERNSEFDKLYISLANNRLTEWTPSFPLILIHGKKDKTVPYLNAEKAYNAFKNAGVDVRLIPTDYDHSESAILFYINLLFELGLI